MSYRRVMPRDLFNEAKLLKCLGQLSLLIEDDKCRKWKLRLWHNTRSSEAFVIDQRQADGGMYCVNLHLYSDARRIDVYTSCNSKEPYPLLFDYGNWTEGDVFNDDGTLTTEFTDYLDELVLK